MALRDAVNYALENKLIDRQPVKGYIAAVSVGIVEGEPRLDLSYAEDSGAEVDMNIVMTESGKFIEVQGTAETEPFDRRNLNEQVDLAAGVIKHIMAAPKEV